jgi:hypothetical protein
MVMYVAVAAWVPTVVFYFWFNNNFFGGLIHGAFASQKKFKIQFEFQETF